MLGIHLVVEVLNRYESHLLNMAEQAIRFVERVESPNVGILLETYHMNIEESDPAGAVATAGAKLQLVHVADSNHRAIGRGNIRFEEILERLAVSGYDSPVIVESIASTPDPFSPSAHAAEARQTLDGAVASLALLRRREAEWERQGVAYANGCSRNRDTYNSNEQQRLLHKEEA